MKVLHVVAALAPRYGGPSRNVVGICRATRALGVDAEICATDADGAAGRLDVPLGERVLWNGVPTRFFSRTFSERYKYSWGMGQWLAESARNYDLILVHGVFSYAPEAAAAAAARASVPHLVVPHGMLSRWALHLRAPAKQVYLVLRARRFIRFASGVICTSAAEEAEVEILGVKAPRVRVLWGIDHQEISTNGGGRREGRKRWKIPDASKVVLFLGRLHPKKGIHDYLLPAFAELHNDALLLIAGPSDPHAPAYEAFVRSEIERQKLSERVRLLGPIYDEAKLAALDCCNVFVLPSHGENVGSAVAEAMARERPIVISENVQLSAEVARAGAGIVVRLDPSAIAAALRLVLTDPVEASRLGAAAKRFVSAHMTWEGAAIRLRDFYESVLTSSTTRSGESFRQSMEAN